MAEAEMNDELRNALLNTKQDEALYELPVDELKELLGQLG
jgi:hypothetical protein